MDETETKNIMIHFTEVRLYFSSIFLKLINNSLSLNKGNHDHDFIWISDLRPVHTYPDIFESANFSSGYGFRPHTFGSESGHLIFKSALQSGEKNSATDESDNVWTGESGYFRVP